MVFAGVFKFRKTNMIFVDPEVNIDGTCCCDVLLTEQLLPVIREISGEFFIFQQASAPAHRACDCSILEWETPPLLHQTCGPWNWTPLTIRYRAKCSSGSTTQKFVNEWTEAASDGCVAWLGTKHYRRRNWWVVQTSPCVYLCQKRTFWAFTLTRRKHVITLVCSVYKH